MTDMDAAALAGDDLREALATVLSRTRVRTDPVSVADEDYAYADELLAVGAQLSISGAEVTRRVSAIREAEFEVEATGLIDDLNDLLCARANDEQ